MTASRALTNKLLGISIAPSEFRVFSQTHVGLLPFVVCALPPGVSTRRRRDGKALGMELAGLAVARGAFRGYIGSSS